MSWSWLKNVDRSRRLVLYAVVLGLIGGAGALFFLWLLHMGEVLLIEPLGHYHFLTVLAAHEHPVVPPFHFYWFIPIATTVGGLLAGVLVYTFAPEAEGHGTDGAVRAFHQTNGYIRARVPLVKSIASALTIGSGGSAGREGPTAQIAAGVGSIMGGLLHAPDDERRLIVLMGMAAGLSAIFKSPLGTAIFAVEILYSGMAFEGEALLYTLVSSAVAYAVVGSINGWTPLFFVPNQAFGSSLNLVWYGVAGALAGIVGAILPSVFYGVRDIFHALRIPNHFKPAIGGLIVGLIGMVLPGILGGGYGYMQLVLEGAAGLSVWFLLLLLLGKMAALSLTIGSGGSGGVFAPTLFIGAILGAGLAALLHFIGFTTISITSLSVVGMAAVFAGAARVPIASLVMVIEMTGGFQLIMPTMVAVSLSFIIQLALTRHSRYPTLYEAQVSLPVDSPVHQRLYQDIATNLLRSGKMVVDEETLTGLIRDRLTAERGIPFMRGNERLFRVPLLAGAPLIGKKVQGLGLPHFAIVSMLRQEHGLVPDSNTLFMVGDEVVIAATPESMNRFREMIAPPTISAGSVATSDGEVSA
ncbi:MAG TPA: chloride channel protein [Acidiferrobacter sp.]|nr:chloride channel protein [Acidiferrobacter sp.]